MYSGSEQKLERGMEVLLLPPLAMEPYWSVSLKQSLCFNLLIFEKEMTSSYLK